MKNKITPPNGQGLDSSAPDNDPKSPIDTKGELDQAADALAVLTQIGSPGTSAGADNSAPVDPQAIVNKLAGWNDVAGVRHDLRQVLQIEQEQNKLFFSPELVPHTQHSLIKQMDTQVQQRLLVAHLHTYFNFTEQLEHKSVISVGIDLAHDETGLILPNSVRAGAYSLITDEAYHAQYCFDLQNQIAVATGVAPVKRQVPAYLKAFEEIQRGLSAEYRTLSQLLFGVVSETLITGTLTKVPKDTRVVSTVCEIMADHAADEGRHHAYFAELFRLVWRQLDVRRREALGPLLARFTRLFLDPDYEAIGHALRQAGLQPVEVEQVIAESYPPNGVAAGAKGSAKATLRLFDQVGALNVAKIYDAFSQEGLIG